MNYTKIIQTKGNIIRRTIWNQNKQKKDGYVLYKTTYTKSVRKLEKKATADEIWIARHTLERIISTTSEMKTGAYILS